MTEDEYFDVCDAISFLNWQTTKEISTKSGQGMRIVNRAIKRLTDEGHLDKKGDKYRYENAHGE